LLVERAPNFFGERNTILRQVNGRGDHGEYSICETKNGMFSLQNVAYQRVLF
jgi:hypothetical protein